MPSMPSSEGLILDATALIDFVGGNGYNSSTAFCLFLKKFWIQIG